MSENTYELPSNHYSQILAYLEEQRKAQNELLCDVCFLVHGVKIYAHRCVLAACSPYFQTMFSGSFKELDVNSHGMCVVDLTETVSDPAHLDLLITCLYKGQIKLMQDNIIDLMFLSSYLMVECVQAICLQYLSDTFNIHTCLSYLALAENLQLHPLLDKAVDLVSNRFHDYFRHQPAIMSLSASCLHYLNPPLQNLPLIAAIHFLLSWIHGGNDSHADANKHGEINIRTNMALEIMRNQCRKFKVFGENFDLQKLSFFSANLCGPSECLQQLTAVIREELGGSGPAASQTHVPGNAAQVGQEGNVLQDTGQKIHGNNLETLGQLMKSVPHNDESGEDQLLHNISENVQVEGKGDNDSLRQQRSNLHENKKFDSEHFTSAEDLKQTDSKSVISTLVAERPTQMVQNSDSTVHYQDDRELESNLNIEHSTGQSSDTKLSHLMISGAYIASAWKDTLSFCTREILNARSEASNSGQVRNNNGSDQLPAEQSKKFTEGDKNVNICDAQVNRCSHNDGTVDVLLVFVPGKRMVAHVTAIECDSGRPRYCPGDLEVCVYNIHERRWLHLGSTIFPGVIDEKSMWKVACLGSHAFFTSLHQQSILQLDLATLTWTHVPAAPVFQTLVNEVRSVLPLAVKGHLYILSSDRLQLDSVTGHYLTHQRYYRLEETGDWIVAGDVEHHHTGLPHTILSVSKGQVFVVKADLMRSLEKNLLIVRGGHVFDVQTGAIEKFTGTIFVPSPARFLVRDGKLHIIDAEGWTWQYQQHLELWGAGGKVDLSDIRWYRGAAGESYYPCLSNVSTAQDSSVWELLGYFNHSSTLLEFRLNAGGQVTTMVHPPPPCRYVMSMTVGDINSSLIADLQMCRYYHE